MVLWANTLHHSNPSRVFIAPKMFLGVFTLTHRASTTRGCLIESVACWAKGKLLKSVPSRRPEKIRQVFYVSKAKNDLREEDEDIPRFD